MKRIRLTLDRDDQRSRRVAQTITELVPSAEVRDARWDDDAAAFLDGLVRCGAVSPVLEVGEVVLTDATPVDAVLLVRREAPELVV